MAGFQIPIYCVFCSRTYEGVGALECPFCTRKQVTPDPPMISYWEGRPVTDLSRDELIAALTDLGRTHAKLLESYSRQLREPQFLTR